ncbi:MAG TPA: hypothetical protein VHG72_10400 [Polyangia bacterium]|nr:hypothetical protein [Polyangia bacterium]
MAETTITPPESFDKNAPPKSRACMNRITSGLTATVVAVCIGSGFAAAASGPPLTCTPRRYQFREAGTYRIHRQDVQWGNKKTASLCFDNIPNPCRKLQDWKADWVVNVNGGQTLGLHQSEYADGHAAGDTETHCSGDVSAAAFFSTNGFSATFLVTRE